MGLIRLALLGAFALTPLAGCKPKNDRDTEPSSVEKPSNERSLAAARKGFATKLKKQYKSNEPVVEPPPEVFRKVSYEAPVGKCAAYLTPDPRDGKKHPAIVWITGGDCNTISDVWKPAPAANDQSARQYRDAGIVMMFPSLRGGNQNPGYQENFLGEVEDVIAAAEHLAKQDYVDPNHIYLGGHSTGGTLALLVAEVPNRFRAVFSFGPADIISRLSNEYTQAVNTGDDQEVELRSPLFWLDSIQNPTFVIEGTEGNVDSLRTMAKSPYNPKVRFPKVRFLAVKGATHFSTLAPVNVLIAKKILADDGVNSNITLTEAELNQLFGR